MRLARDSALQQPHRQRGVAVVERSVAMAGAHVRACCQRGPDVGVRGLDRLSDLDAVRERAAEVLDGLARGEV